MTFQKILKKKNISMYKLARITGIDYYTLWRLKHGITKNPQVDTVVKLSTVGIYTHPVKSEEADYTLE